MIYPTAAALALQVAVAPMIPPAHWDHPFKGRVDKLWLSPADTDRICTKGHPACVFSGQPKGICRIYISNAFRGTAWEAIIVRHEVAHCNGWNASHSN